MPETIRVLIIPEDGMFVAQCVEYDIGAQAKDIPTLRRRFNAVFSADIEESVRRHGVPFAGIDRAPVCYEHMWDAAGKELTHIGTSDAIPSNSPHVSYELALCA